MNDGQSGDEATTGEPVERGLGEHSLDRRSLIKKVGIAGAAAWVAPVVIESLISPASAASIPPGTYRLRLSSERCNPTPLLAPDAVAPPPMCSPLASDFPHTDFAITTQSQLDAFDIVISNCSRRYAIHAHHHQPQGDLHRGRCGCGQPSLPGSVQPADDAGADRRDLGRRAPVRPQRLLHHHQRHRLISNSRRSARLDRVHEVSRVGPGVDGRVVPRPPAGGAPDR